MKNLQYSLLIVHTERDKPLLFKNPFKLCIQLGKVHSVGIYQIQNVTRKERRKSNACAYWAALVCAFLGTFLLTVGSNKDWFIPFYNKKSNACAKEGQEDLTQINLKKVTRDFAGRTKLKHERISGEINFNRRRLWHWRYCWNGWNGSMELNRMPSSIMLLGHYLMCQYSYHAGQSVGNHFRQPLHSFLFSLWRHLLSKG